MSLVRVLLLITTNSENIMDEVKTIDPPFKYRVDEKFLDGSVIKFIYGQSTETIVFEDTQSGLKWGVRPDQLSPSQAEAVSRFDRLHARIRRAITKDS